MKLLTEILLLIVVALLSGCSNNDASFIYDDTSFYSNPCQENEDEILHQSGSSDAPELHISRGIESGIVSLNWTGVAGVEYYILEECECPGFSSVRNSYEVYQNEFVIEHNYPYFYRVCAVIGSYRTGWSNVVKNIK